MLKLDDILEMWNKDSYMDDSNLSREILNIPRLHVKYLKELNDHKLASIKCKYEYDKMKHIKTEYYSGNLDKESLDEYGWDQFDLRIGSKGNIDRYIGADEQLIKILQKKAYHEQIVYTCESILHEIKNRSWQLKSLIEWNKFQAGA